MAGACSCTLMKTQCCLQIQYTTGLVALANTYLDSICLYFMTVLSQENAKAFSSKPLVDVDVKCLLYVQQREFAATLPSDRKCTAQWTMFITMLFSLILNVLHTFSLLSLLIISPLLWSNPGAVSVIGSDDATTCHLVVVRHTGR